MRIGQNTRRKANGTEPEIPDMSGSHTFDNEASDLCLQTMR